MKRSFSSRAFTLVELLVVIAIIGILVALAVPALTKAMERGKSVQGLNNLKQIGTATLAYINDNDDFAFEDSNWPKELYPKYIEDTKVFLSPFDARASSGTAPFPVSYGYNTNLIAEPNTAVWENTSKLIMAAPAPSGTDPLTFSGTSDSAPTLSQGISEGTHAGGKQLNVLFADFHVSSTTVNQLSDTDQVSWRPKDQN